MTDFTNCTTCNGHGYTTCDHPEADDYMDCPDCDGGGTIDTRPAYSPGFAQWLAATQRIAEIDAYLASPAAHWAPCGTLDALDAERAELENHTTH